MDVDVSAVERLVGEPVSVDLDGLLVESLGDALGLYVSANEPPAECIFVDDRFGWTF